MGRILLATSNNTDEEYGGNIDEMYPLGNLNVNISSYTSSSNMYTIPEDGYIMVVGAQATEDKLVDITFAPDGWLVFRNRGVNQVGGLINTMFVRKGMQCYISSNTLNANVVFRN